MSARVETVPVEGGGPVFVPVCGEHRPDADGAKANADLHNEVNH